MENWVQGVISKWKSEDIKLNPPATIVEIENTEAVLNFTFPADFKEFYLQANGFNEWDMLDNSYISLWPLDRIIEEYNKWGGPEFIGVCDFLINSHAIGFVKNQSGVFKSYNYLENNAIAETYQEAIRMINSGAGAIY